MRILAGCSKTAMRGCVRTGKGFREASRFSYFRFVPTAGLAKVFGVVVRGVYAPSSENSDHPALTRYSANDTRIRNARTGNTQRLLRSVAGWSRRCTLGHRERLAHPT